MVDFWGPSSCGTEDFWAHLFEARFLNCSVWLDNQLREVPYCSKPLLSLNDEGQGALCKLKTVLSLIFGQGLLDLAGFYSEQQLKDDLEK